MYQSRILVVDDQYASRETLRTILTGEGYQVCLAEDGMAALRLAHEFLPDLILLDVMMPDMDGFETCRRLREIPLLAEIPVLFLTALSHYDARLTGLASGADEFISKPFDNDELKQRIRNITKLNRYRKLLEQRSRFEWVVEQAQEGYLLLNDSASVEYANAAARRYFHLGLEDPLPPCPFLELAQQHYQCEPASTWESWPAPTEQSLPRYLVRAETPNSQGLWLQVESFSPAFSEGWLVCLREVTDAVDRYQRTWYFHELVTHKLNTPLNAFNALGMLLPKLRPLLDPDSLDLLKVVEEGAAQLRGHLNQIVSYINMPFSSTTEDPLAVSDIAEMISAIQRQLGIDLEFFEMPPSSCENGLPLSRSALQVVLAELLNNAKQFHPLRTPYVEIECHCDPADFLLLQVRDDGRHLPLEVLDKVWIPYFQHEKYFTGETHGMGLGLPTVASIVWRVGGTCRILNRAEIPGIIVEIKLPLSPA